MQMLRNFQSFLRQKQGAPENGIYTEIIERFEGFLHPVLRDLTIGIGGEQKCIVRSVPGRIGHGVGAGPARMRDSRRVCNIYDVQFKREPVIQRKRPRACLILRIIDP